MHFAGARARVFWITEIDQSRMQELQSQKLWDWEPTRARRHEVDEIVADFAMAKEGMVRPHVLGRGYVWKSYNEWVAGEMPRAMGWSTLDILDGKVIMKGTAQLTEDKVVDFEPTWCTYG